MNRLFTVFCLCLLSLTASAKFAFTEKNFADTVSFTYNSICQMIVPITIQGKTYDFVFDTGAMSCLIPDTLADELITKSLKSSKVRGAFDRKGVKSNRGIMPEITIGNLHLNGCETISSNITECFFGAWLLYQYGISYKIDLMKRQIIFTDRRKFFDSEEKTAYDLPINYFKTATYLDFQISNGGQCTGILDTGNNCFFHISKKYFDAFRSSRDSSAFSKQIVCCDTAVYVDYKGKVYKSEEYFIKPDSINIGKLTFIGAPVYTTEVYTGIGCRILEYGSLIVDSKKLRVYFKPYESDGNVVKISPTFITTSTNTFR